MTQLLLATTNPGKVAEFRALLARHCDLSRLSLVTPRDLPLAIPTVAETGSTFAENALLKARALAAASGLIALADDSGLCVDALGGAPGLHSARWAGEQATDADRMAALLEVMQTVPDAGRTARFVCAAAVAAPNGSAYAAEGILEGRITASPRGALGFGYDPLFLIPALGRTLAELTADEKNALSHRAAALLLLAPFLQTLLK